MADELRIVSRPELNEPVLIAAFRGWNDGGQGASLAAGYLAKIWRAARFADIDPEHFYDFQATRPHVALEEGLTRRVDWPENAFYHARVPGISRDAVVLLGVEPNLRWRAFTGLVMDLAGDLGVEMVITLGALLADVPHTRPAPVTGSATDEKLIEELGLQGSRYEGPTGIVGVLHDACRRRASGQRFRTTRRSRRARAPLSHSANGSGACSGPRSTRLSWTRLWSATASRSAPRSRPIRTRRRTSSSSRSVPTTSPPRRTSRAASRSQPS